MTLAKKHLNGNQLKLIAIIAMTIDHLTWVIFPGMQAVWYVFALHIIGRLTAPIMWFFIAEGCFYTRNIWKYAGRLFIFALISHFAYNFAFGIPFLPFSTGSFFNQTGVMWSLAWAVVLIAIFKSEKIPQWAKYLAIPVICVITFPSDWSCIAVMCPFFLYQHRGNFKAQAIDIVLWTLMYAVDTRNKMAVLHLLSRASLCCRNHQARPARKRAAYILIIKASENREPFLRLARFAARAFSP